jgi:uncharacterized protein DUF892
MNVSRGRRQGRFSSSHCSDVPSSVSCASQEHPRALCLQRHQNHEDLFVHQLQDIYYAEKQLVKALPIMAEKSRRDVQRLEQVFRTHAAEVKGATAGRST